MKTDTYTQPIVDDALGGASDNAGLAIPTRVHLECKRVDPPGADQRLLNQATSPRGTPGTSAHQPSEISGSNPMSRPRVAQLISTFNIGGAETFVVELCRQLQQGPFCPVAIALRETGAIETRLRETGIPAFALNAVEGKGLHWPSVFRLARLLRREKIRVLHCHNRVSHIYGAIAARIAFLPARGLYATLCATRWRTSPAGEDRHSPDHPVCGCFGSHP